MPVYGRRIDKRGRACRQAGRQAGGQVVDTAHVARLKEKT
jgi:hypothetical protein